MKYKEFDVVKIKIDQNNIKSGSIGVIIMVFDTPREAYEVEILDAEGNYVDQGVFLPDNIEKVV